MQNAQKIQLGEYKLTGQNAITLKALAKINIGLDVTGTRADGYHMVNMIMQTVHMYDVVTVEKTEGNDISMTTDSGFLPTDDSNLCIKAAKLMREAYPEVQGVKIHLEKNIPVAAGMAGGSSDAASVLYGINRIYELGLSIEELQEIGVKIGADVPYCLMRGTALAAGIGEKLTRLPDMMRCPVLIAKPAVSVSTKEVYQALDAIADPKHPDIDAMIKDIENGDLHALASHMGNILEEVTIPMHPEIADIKKVMMENGAVISMMSGSGPTVFGFFDDEDAMKQAKEAVEKSGLANVVRYTSIYNV